jgi:hypothetical protein
MGGGATRTFKRHVCLPQPEGSGEIMGKATLPLSQHWTDDSTRCDSPAMGGTRYCYSHHLARAQGARKNAEHARQRWLESVPLQDAASVQRALVQVRRQLLSGNIGHRRAGQILYKLQTASVNLRTVELGPGRADDEPPKEPRSAKWYRSTSVEFGKALISQGN